MKTIATIIGDFFVRGTLDEDIFKSVVTNNEYSVNAELNGKIVIDIGANIGCFSLACLLNGAKEIYAFEPRDSNFAMLKKNMDSHKKVTVSKKAVWRSDKNEPFVTFNNGQHEGAGFVTKSNSNEGTETISLDTIISKIADSGQRIGLLKIDCEGSEFAILYTSKMLSHIDAIIGEIHFFSWLYNNKVDEFGKPHKDARPLNIHDLPYLTDGESFFQFLRDNGFTVKTKHPLEYGHSIGALAFSAKRD